jgi:hypothetical protein
MSSCQSGPAHKIPSYPTNRSVRSVDTVSEILVQLSRLKYQACTHSSEGRGVRPCLCSNWELLLRIQKF